MPKPFSLDLRQRILQDVLSGMTYARIGRKYSVSAEFVRRFHRRYEATREVGPRPSIPRVVPFHQLHEAAIRDAVANNPGLTLEQLRTVTELEDFPGQVPDAFTPDECENDFKSSGYPPATSTLEPL